MFHLSTSNNQPHANLAQTKGSFKKKQAKNGLQSRSSENASVALWIEIALLTGDRDCGCYSLVWFGGGMDYCHG